MFLETFPGRPQSRTAQRPFSGIVFLGSGAHDQKSFKTRL